ncbi:hypothetical protein ACN26Z_20790 [Verrucosispora sp. WMMD703]|uniref:hypothetical protein n=1 Tax=Verrucosispora sp. WMMD703 TaxID=3403463 RepID=UPI003B961F33
MASAGSTGCLSWSVVGRGKKFNGRKRFIVTDALGLLVIVRVLAALWQDRDGAKGALLATYTIEQRTVFRHPGESPPKDRMLGHDEWP